MHNLWHTRKLITEGGLQGSPKGGILGQLLQNSDKCVENASHLRGELDPLTNPTEFATVYNQDSKSYTIILSFK